MGLATLTLTLTMPDGHFFLVPTCTIMAFWVVTVTCADVGPQISLFPPENAGSVDFSQKAQIEAVWAKKPGVT